MTRSFACSWIKLKAISGFSLIGVFLCASVGQERPGLTWVHRNIRLTSVLVNLMQSVAWWLIEILLKNTSANTDTKNKNTDTNTYTLNLGLWWWDGNRVEKCKPIINLRFNCKCKNTDKNTVTNKYRCKKSWSMMMRWKSVSASLIWGSSRNSSFRLSVPLSIDRFSHTSRVRGEICQRFLQINWTLEIWMKLCLCTPEVLKPARKGRSYIVGITPVFWILSDKFHICLQRRLFMSDIF